MRVRPPPVAPLLVFIRFEVRVMKIELQYPYTEHYNAGYQVFSQGRYNIILKEKGTNKLTTTSLARYNMSVHMQRYLERHEEVDHVNNDKVDNRIENLQILSPRQNKVKYNREVVGGRAYFTAICPVCETTFDRPLNQLKNSSFLTCSVDCNTSAKRYPGYRQRLIIHKYRKPLED